MDVFSLLIFLTAAISWCHCDEQGNLLLVTIATDENDGLRRYLRSIKKYGLETKVLGLGEEWRGGDMTGQGGGHKINILKQGLQQYKDQEDLIIMFTDSYDVVLTAGAEEILDKFKKFDARVVFSAEGFCWPDRTLADQYPAVKVHEKRYLCSGGFIGYARDVYDIVSYKTVEDTYDDQLYYTNIFLDQTLREKWSIKLDKRSEIFINLHGVLDDVMLKYKGSHSFLYNVKTGTVPIVIHGNGPIKPEFNRLANYLADGWTSSNGCISCDENTVSLDGLQEDDYPTILMGLYIEKPTPFLTEFFQHVAKLDYPKSKIDLILHNNIEAHQQEVKPFLLEHGPEYSSLNIISPSDGVSEANARNWAIEECIKKDCQYMLNIDGDIHLENENSIKLLLKQNRSVLAPMIVRWSKAWSNFWGSLSSTGFYARSEDYMDIVNRDRVGLWNVPYLTGVYLVQAHMLPGIRNAYTAQDLDPDMAFCRTLREKGHFMFVTNRDWHGHLLHTENYDMSHKHNELFEIFNNPYDWDKRYVHPDHSVSLKPETVIEQPCPDVFWFPIVTDTFCDELVDEMEHFGGWSGGKNNDNRLAGGYENVPTDDIHMTQVGLQQQWLEFLKIYVAPLATRVYPGYYSNDKRLSTGYENVPTDDIHMTQIGLQDDWLEFLKNYVQPLQLKVYPGYYQNPPNALLNFVVKYHPERQRELRPHHDSSTFTINIALNRPHIDFEGGGCRFIRYNCSVTETRKGWMMMHPGRLTHFHEGLTVTGGTRYIFVSFVDP